MGDERVVAYCGAGISATLDAFALTLLGAPDVAVYDGSMSEWVADPALAFGPRLVSRRTNCVETSRCKVATGSIRCIAP